MHQINTRGTFMVSKYAIPYLEKAANPHILMLSPPLDMKEKWFAPHTAYTMAKFGMSLVVLGLSGELRPKGIAVNALWPRTTIATAAIKNLLGGDEIMRLSRKPGHPGRGRLPRSSHKPASFTGNFLIDDTFLAARGRHRFRPLPGRSERSRWRPISSCPTICPPPRGCKSATADRDGRQWEPWAPSAGLDPAFHRMKGVPRGRADDRRDIATWRQP